MPALFALAQHEGLVAASRNLLPSERLFAFLDDLYVVTTRARANKHGFRGGGYTSGAPRRSKDPPRQAQSMVSGGWACAS